MALPEDRRRKMRQGREIIHYCTVLIDFLRDPPPDFSANPELLADLLLMRSFAREVVERAEKEDEL